MNWICIIFIRCIVLLNYLIFLIKIIWFKDIMLVISYENMYIYMEDI